MTMLGNSCEYFFHQGAGFIAGGMLKYKVIGRGGDDLVAWKRLQYFLIKV